MGIFLSKIKMDFNSSLIVITISEFHFITDKVEIPV